jgi:hypothetical protein
MVMEMEAEVDTVIVSGAIHPRKVERMQTAYACSGHPELRKIWVEKPGFLDTCIAQGRVQHILPRFRGLGNQIARRYVFCLEQSAFLNVYGSVEAQLDRGSSLTLRMIIISRVILPAVDPTRNMEAAPVMVSIKRSLTWYI